MIVYVEQTVTTEWHVDPDELRDAYPNEYAEWRQHVRLGDDPDVPMDEYTDESWVGYAFASGCEFGDVAVSTVESVDVWS